MEYRALAAATKQIDTSARTVTAWVSTESVDRMEEVLLATGCGYDDYMKNPVVLWAHETWIPPIGKCVNLSIFEGEGVEGVTQFADTQFGDEVFQLYAGGFMRAFSVGFQPKSWTNGSDDVPRTYTKWDMYEYSAVPVPANPDALAKAAKSGIDAASHILRLYYPEERDLIGAARVACDLRRIKNGAESILNYRRHLEKSGETLDLEDLTEVLAPLKELGLVIPAGSDTGDLPNEEPATGDLPDKAVAELSELIKGLTTTIAKVPDLEDTVRREIQRQRQALIGR